MNKFLTMLLLLFSMSAFANDPNEPQCLDAKQLSSKMNNFNEADIPNADKSKACGSFLGQIDRILVSGLESIATKSDVRKWEKELTSLGNIAEKTINAMRDENTMTTWMHSYIYVTQWTVIFFVVAITIGTCYYKELLPKAILAIGGSIYIAFVTYNYGSFYTGLVILVTSFSNFIVWNAGDHESISDLSNHNYSDVGEALATNALDLASSIHRVEAINQVTALEAFDNLWSSHVEIDKTLYANGFDIDEPTISEFKQYHKHCKQRDYVEVDDKFNLHITNLNWSSLSNKAIFYSGGTDTKHYNCDEGYYGKKSLALLVQSTVAVLIDRYIDNNLTDNLGEELTLADRIKIMFDSESGTLKLLIEQAEDVASADPEMFETQILMGEEASIEAADTGTSFRNTASYQELLSYYKTKMGTTHDYVEVDGLDPYQMVGYFGIVATHFAFTELFNESGIYDSIVTDKRKMGYHFLQPYIKETINFALEYNCSTTLSSTYEDRVKFAEYFNGLDQDKKLKHQSPFSEMNDTHCYRFYDNGDIEAGGDGKDNEAFRKMVEHRFNALNVLFDARTQASLQLILENEDLTDEIVLKGLNSISTNVSDSMNSHIIMTDAQQKLRSALQVIQDAYIFESNVNYDVTRPAYYYNFKRFSDGNDIEEKAIDKNLNKYDLSPFFEHTTTEYVKNAEDITRSKEGSIAKMARYECPVLEDGECKANLLQLNSAASNMLLEQTLYLTAIEKTASLASAGCSTAEKATEEAAGPIFGKARYANLAGVAACGTAYVLDGMSQIFVVPYQIASAIMAFVMFAMKLLPSVIDLVRHFLPYLVFVVPTLILTAAFIFDVFVSFWRFIFSNHTAQDFDEFMSLKITTAIFYSMFVATFAYFVTLYVIMMILTSKIGGATYDIVFYGYSGVLVEAILRSFISFGVFAYLTYASIFVLPKRIFNQMGEFFNAKGLSFSDETSSFAQSFIVGFGFGAGAKLKSMSGSLDKKINDIGKSENKDGKDTPPKGNGGNDKGGKPNSDSDIKTDIVDKDSDDLDNSDENDSSDIKSTNEDSKIDSGKNKLEEWKDDVDEFNKNRTKTTVNKTGEDAIKDALNDHYDFKNNDE
ncbi:DMT family transporter [Vibrio parahaemolyticus]|nr:DMT family transporter [Vibrio parahaemolyticus]